MLTATAHQSSETGVSDAFRDRYLRVLIALIIPPSDNIRGGGHYD